MGKGPDRAARRNEISPQIHQANSGRTSVPCLDDSEKLNEKTLYTVG